MRGCLGWFIGQQARRTVHESDDGVACKFLSTSVTPDNMSNAWNKMSACRRIDTEVFHRAPSGYIAAFAEQQHYRWRHVVQVGRRCLTGTAADADPGSGLTFGHDLNDTRGPSQRVSPAY